MAMNRRQQDAWVVSQKRGLYLHIVCLWAMHRRQQDAWVTFWSALLGWLPEYQKFSSNARGAAKESLSA